MADGDRAPREPAARGPARRPAARAVDRFARVQPRDRAAWRRWLAEHHDRSPGVWLAYYKKSSGRSRLGYDEAVEEALCYGWIDSLPRRLDDERALLLFTPRKPASAWSRINKERVARLIGDGRMAAPGLAKIDAAKADGSWEKLDAVESLVVPDDLRRALAANADARRRFEAFPPGSRKIILGWIASARRPETRAARIDEAVRLAAQNIRANHYRQ